MQALASTIPNAQRQDLTKLVTSLAKTAIGCSATIFHARNRRILRDPYLAMCCGYSFCYTCSQQVWRNNSPCPWCRKKKFEVRENKGMSRSLNQLGVYCTYSIDGCTWRGELRELQTHLDNTDHSGESLQYERASRYTVTIYSLLGACRGCLRWVWVSCICWSNQWLVASIMLLWEEIGVQWLWHRHRKSGNKDKQQIAMQLRLLL